MTTFFDGDTGTLAVLVNGQTVYDLTQVRFVRQESKWVAEFASNSEATNRTLAAAFAPDPLARINASVADYFGVES